MLALTDDDDGGSCGVVVCRKHSCPAYQRATARGGKLEILG
jgi:hypothetical protein